MNSNTFALSSSSPVGRRGGGRGKSECSKLIRHQRTAMTTQKMVNKNLKFHQQPWLYITNRLMTMVQSAFQKGNISLIYILNISYYTYQYMSMFSIIIYRRKDWRIWINVEWIMWLSDGTTTSLSSTTGIGRFVCEDQLHETGDQIVVLGLEGWLSRWNSRWTNIQGNLWTILSPSGYVKYWVVTVIIKK